MRPHRLVLRGFRSYADEAEFELTGRSLVGVVGPIGSGKSTLLDAVAFALYGQTPTVGKQTRSLINQRQDAAHVELWFGVGSETWRAVRALRRKGQSAHALERHRDGERVELIEGEKAVNGKVSELLGLDFHAFGRSVLLAQNQFARFLDATGGERDAVLKGVFGLDRIESVRDLAKARRDAAGRDLEELERRRAEVEADRATLAEARRDLADAAARAAAFERAAADEGAIRKTEDAAAAAAVAAEAAVARLSAIAARLPSRTETAALLAAAEADAQQIASAREAMVAAEDRLASARDALATATARGGDREALARLEADVKKADELRAAGAAALAAAAKADAAVEIALADHQQAERRRALADADAARAASKLEECTAAAAQAESALHEARHEEMAAALRSGLSHGDHCPVCGREVADLPQVQPAELAAAERAASQAASAVAVATRTRRESEAAAAAAAAEVAAAAVRWREAEAVAGDRRSEANKQAGLLSEIEASLRAALGEGDPTEALAERRAALGRALAAAAQAETERDEAREAVAEAEETAAGRRAAMQTLATEVAALGGTMGTDIRVGDQRRELSEALEALRAVWETQSAAAEDGLKDAARRAEAARRDRAQLHRDIGIGIEDDFAAARVAAKTAEAAASQTVSLLTERVSRVDALEKENAATRRRFELYGRIADDLAPSRFLAYLLDEERVALAALAAERFEMLSGGRYRFSEDGSFDVLDLTAADAVRKPRSLSGGETFLASLALALALAEMVSRTGGRLEAFFLDEGFGSLDPEHLDLAMEGIERLVTDDGNRLVLVVSHVAELRTRLEDVIELDKHPVTGDTVVVRA